MQDWEVERVKKLPQWAQELIGRQDKTIARLRAEIVMRDVPGRCLTELRRAQAIINRLRDYREQLLTLPLQSTHAMRARIRELETPARDDHDRAVLMLLDDFERMERLTKTEVAP